MNEPDNELRIETPRLWLRDLLEADIQPFYRLASDPMITQYQSFIQVNNEGQALKWLEGAVFHNQQRPRKVYNLAIIRKQDAEWLGWIGIGPPSNRTEGDLDFGYALDHRYWGMGYMTEALRYLIDYCFVELGINLIFGDCDQNNLASARVMKKAGMHLNRSYLEVDQNSGQERQMLRYALSRQDWASKLC